MGSLVGKIISFTAIFPPLDSEAFWRSTERARICRLGPETVPQRVIFKMDSITRMWMVVDEPFP